VATEVEVPIIGIGAGNGVDGQVLVSHDMLGMNQEFSPRFLRRYLNLHEDMTMAVQRYIADVRSKDFPNSRRNSIRFYNHRLSSRSESLGHLSLLFDKFDMAPKMLIRDSTVEFS
jgi:hypothetical protein